MVLEELTSLQIVVAPHVAFEKLAEIKQVAESYQLNAYDAIYLDLAICERLPLATNDAAPRRACALAAVPVL